METFYEQNLTRIGIIQVTTCLSQYKIQIVMNCHQKSEAHVWRFSKHTKMRRCVKCKSRIPITKEEFAQKWGTKTPLAK